MVQIDFAVVLSENIQTGTGAGGSAGALTSGLNKAIQEDGGALKELGVDPEATTDATGKFLLVLISSNVHYESKFE